MFNNVSFVSYIHHYNIDMKITDDIERLLKQGLSISDVSDRLKIHRNTIRGICKRHNIKYEKKHKGRPEGAYDKKPRTRAPNKPTNTTKRGGADMEQIKQLDATREQFMNESEAEITSYNNNLKKNDNLDIFLNSALKEATRPVTIEDVKNYNINRFKTQ